MTRDQIEEMMTNMRMMLLSDWRRCLTAFLTERQRMTKAAGDQEQKRPEARNDRQKAHVHEIGTMTQLAIHPTLLIHIDRPLGVGTHHSDNHLGLIQNSIKKSALEEQLRNNESKLERKLTAT